MSLLTVGWPEWTGTLVLAVGWALILFLGQGLLLFLIVAALLRAWQDRSADLRYGAACAGLLAMALCPLVTSVLIVRAKHDGTSRLEAGLRRIPMSFEVRRTSRAPEPTAIPATTVARSADRPPASNPLGENRAGASRATPSEAPAWRWQRQVEGWLPGLVIAWLSGVLVLSLRLVRGLVEVRSLMHQGVETPSDELQGLIGRLVERSGVQRPVGWFLSRRVEVPTVVGWLRPVVLIPAGALARLTLRHLEALLAHEIAHIRRHDSLVNLVQVAVEALLFFHPAVWWVSNQVRIERENGCDDLAAALCDGDRQLIARALFAMEEERNRTLLGVAATDGSLRQRVLRLLTPTSPAPRRPAEAGWAGAGLLAASTALLAATGWLTTPTRVQADNPPSTMHGRILDEAGRPIASARVRLYRRENRWERRNRLIEETKAGSDGAYRLTTPLEPPPRHNARSFEPYVLVADHPGKAVGWKIALDSNNPLAADIILTSPIERTILVVDPDDRPVADAKVTASTLGDASSPRSEFEHPLILRPDDGPLTAVTGADGRATFNQLPNTRVSFIATKPRFAENYAFFGQETIHLTPGASLSGTVTGPDGRPLAGVEVVLFTTFMWHFERTVTNAKGQYHFDDLKARNWDMSAWRENQKANGQYSLWLDNDRFATPTKSLTLEPGTKSNLDIQALEAGIIRVTVVESGTNKPVANVSVEGFDVIRGARSSGRRFSATTNEQGQATFRPAPSQISLSASGPPPGRYLLGNGLDIPDGHAKFDFPGGDVDVRLVIPPATGPLISITGTCVLPDDAPAEEVSVSANGGRFLTSSSMSLIRTRRSDRRGIFILNDVPAGQTLRIYAETQNRSFAGTTTFQAPNNEDPEFRLRIKLIPTVSVERRFVGEEGVLRKIEISPMVAGEEMLTQRRTIELDAKGQAKIDGVVPGLPYRIVEIKPRLETPADINRSILRPSPVAIEVLAPVKGR